MKKAFTTNYFIWAFLSALLMVQLSCSQKKSSQTTEGLISLTEEDLLEKRDVLLSSLIDSLEIIRLENADDAYLKIGNVVVSDNYIALISYMEKPTKLFKRSGEYIGNIGNYGQGPGEYTFLYNVLFDENNGRIHVGLYNSNHLMTYNLKGEYIASEQIPLAFTVRKGAYYLDRENDRISVINMPFDGMDSIFCYTQNFKGEPMGLISSENYGIQPDYSSEIYVDQTYGKFNFHIQNYGRAKQDTLFCYDYLNNKLIPLLTMFFPIKIGRYHVSYLDLPRHYSIITENYDEEFEGKKQSLIMVDKKNKESYRVNLINDYLGNIKIKPSHLKRNLKDGYYTQWYEPEQLQEIITQALEDTSLSSESKKYLTALNNSLDTNDNTIILLGRLKQ